jgi:membrane-associated protease RseP (regulator of RpoE activity)
MEPNAPNGHNGHGGRDGHGDHGGPGGHDGHVGHGLGVLRQARVWIVVLVLVALLAIFARSKLAFVLGIVIFVVALLGSVMLHELGHFLTAKKFGMRVTQFFLGFGTTLWSTFRGETEYGVKALPFGGFVKITGMTSLEEVDVADEPRSFRNQPGWQRIIVLAAGSFMHFVLALVLLFILAFAIGQANSNTNVVSSIAACVPASNAALNKANPCAGHNLGKSPAQLAGIKPKDKIVSVAGKPVATWNQLHTALTAQQAGTPIPVEFQRNGQDHTVTLRLASIPGRSVPYLGVEPAVLYQRSSFFGAWGYAGDQFSNTLTSSASAISKLPAAIPDLFAKDRASTPAGQVSSVYGVAQVTGDVAEAALPWQAKVTVVLFLIASLNIFVGAFNLLPLLPLDGGHLAVVIFERIRAWFARLFGRPDPGPVDIQRLVPASLLVFAVLVGFGTLLLAADIFNPVHIQL